MDESYDDGWEEMFESAKEILDHACDYFRAKAAGDEAQTAREEAIFRTAYNDAPAWLRHGLPLIK